MSLQYQRFLKVLEKWPVDKTKAGRDLADQIRKHIKYLSNPVTLNQETSVKITRHIDSLERLANNTYGSKYKRVFTSTATGLTAQQCNQVLQYLNEEK